MQQTDERQRQKRSHLKVRTGCQTCKTRRVKCDEGHPECGRCRLAHRKCVYAVPKAWLFEPKKEVAPVMIQSKPLTVGFGNSREKRAFQFFREMTAPQFGGNHELAQSFWSKFIVGVANEDNLVFRLAVAMGAQHEALLLRSTDASELAASSHAVVLSTMARHLNTMRLDISLLCCGMLMGYANLCDEVPATAAIHLGLGLKILREDTIQGPRAMHDSMGAYIDPMFTELELATALFRIPSTDVEMIFSEAEGLPSMPQQSGPLIDLREARQALADIHRWMLYVAIRYRSSAIDLQTEINKADQLLLQWRQSLETYAASLAGGGLPTFYKARKMLFQYKLFVMCRSAAKNQVFQNASRVQTISVDFTKPHLTSVLCAFESNSSRPDWTPLGIGNERERDELDIWPQGEPVGQDGSSQIIRITLGS